MCQKNSSVCFSIIWFLLPLQIQLVWCCLEDRKASTPALSNCRVSAAERSLARRFWSCCSEGMAQLGSAHSFPLCCDREQSGMLFHHPDSYSHMQGSQNLAFPSKIRIQLGNLISQKAEFQREKKTTNLSKTGTWRELLFSCRTPTHVQKPWIY